MKLIQANGLYTSRELEILLSGFVSLEKLRSCGLRGLKAGYYGRNVLTALDRLCEAPGDLNLRTPPAPFPKLEVKRRGPRLISSADCANVEPGDSKRAERKDRDRTIQPESYLRKGGE